MALEVILNLRVFLAESGKKGVDGVVASSVSSTQVRSHFSACSDCSVKLVLSVNILVQILSIEELH